MANGNQVVLLYGMPAAGKLTMAKRLAEDRKSVLMDIHIFFDFANKFIEHRIYHIDRAKSYHDHIMKIKYEFIKLLSDFRSKDGPVRYIFTNVLVNPDHMTTVKALEELAEKINGEFFPIYIYARPEVLKSRCAAPWRVKRGKLHKPEQYDVFNGKFGQLELEHPNRLVVDSSDLSEDETFAVIANHLSRRD